MRDPCETYAAVEAGLLTTSGRVTVVVQNPGGDTCSYDLTTANEGIVPTQIEMLSLPNLTSPTWAPATVRAIAPSLVVALSPYSGTRIIWEGAPHVVRKHLRRSP